MNEIITELVHWLDPPKVIGLFFAITTLGYIATVAIIHHKSFWQGLTGDDGKVQFIEGTLIIWLALFAPMIVADFCFGLVASERAWWSMDSVFLVGVTGGVVRNRFASKETKATDEKVN